MIDKPRILLIAGPTGAGKTTFALQFLRHEAAIKHFVNSDLIAAGLSPLHPELAMAKSTKLMSESIDEQVALRHSFALETSLAGLRYSKHIPVWRALGFRVELYFLALASPDLSVARAAARGGATMTDDVIWRRFAAGVDHFERIYKGMVDAWWRFDTSPGVPLADAGRPPTEAPAALRRAFEDARQAARQMKTQLVIGADNAVRKLDADDPYFNAPNSPLK